MKTKGSLYLEFRQKKTGVTYLSNQYYKLPLQITVPFYLDQDGSAFLYLLNPSGGMLEGDFFDLRFDMNAGTKALITTPSANKVYKTQDQPAEQELNINLMAGSVLEYLPKHNILYAASKFRQVTNIYLDPEATLFTWDILSPGRATRGEVFAYTFFQSQLNFYLNEQLFFRDSMLLEPAMRDLSQVGLLEGRQLLAACYVYQKDMDKALVQKIKSCLAEFDHSMGGATQVSDSFLVVKILSDKVQDIYEVTTAVWKIARRELLSKDIVKL